MEDRPHLSITLPRNFMFHYQDGQPPRTPEPEAQLDDPQPPPPPRQVLKVRRRRMTFVPTPAYSDPEDVMPIPTIEEPELHLESSPELPTLPPVVDNEYLSPALTWTRMLSPPKTPISQMGSLSNFDGEQHWPQRDQTCQSETSSRPTSSSGFSDSSVDSFDSFSSLGGSCASPKDEQPDPFSFCSPVSKYTPSLRSPFAIQQQQQQQQQKKLKLKASFTEEMDYHLWVTYMKYLQDPTVTPFKALPTTVPPNGVCHRVARLARHTWKGPRKSPIVPSVRAASRFLSRHGTPDTIRPAKSGSSTPVPGANKPYPRFPAEKQVRRRLRYLAKAKPSFSAHYQRLMRRSPSPLQSSPPPEEPPRPAPLSSPFLQEATSFSTRDMNVSLATSTAPSMQIGNPLSQLASTETPRPAEVERAHMRASAHQKSQSLHSRLGLGLSDVFGPSLQDTPQTADVVMTQPSARTWHAASARPKLGSPVQLHAPRPISRAFKRRALHNFEDQARNRGNSFISHVFGAPAESSHRRVRSRGFSLGDMDKGSRRLPLSTSGPAEFNPFANIHKAAHPNPHPSPVSPEVHGQATIRLGSPFGGRPSNTFPRASTSHGFEPPASFEQRFAAVPSDADLFRH